MDPIVLEGDHAAAFIANIHHLIRDGQFKHLFVSKLTEQGFNLRFHWQSVVIGVDFKANANSLVGGDVLTIEATGLDFFPGDVICTTNFDLKHHPQITSSKEAACQLVRLVLNPKIMEYLLAMSITPAYFDMCFSS